MKFLPETEQEIRIWATNISCTFVALAWVGVVGGIAYGLYLLADHDTMPAWFFVGYMLWNEVFRGAKYRFQIQDRRNR